MTTAGALACCPCTGHLTINGINMHTPAWCIVDLIELWMPPKTRGVNIVIPHVSGTRARPYRITETDYSLPMMISGAVDQFGAPDAAGVMARLWKNMKYLHDNVTDPPTAPTATVPASLLMPDATTLTADVQVIGMTLGYHIAELTKATLDIRIPAGRFT